MTKRLNQACCSLVIAATGLLSAVLLAGCAATVEPGPTLAQRFEGTKPAPPPTAFLGHDYALLRADPDDKLALVYNDPKAKWSGYTKVLVEPVQFWAAPNTSLAAADQQVLTNYFYNRLKEELGKVLPLADEPAQGVITVQTALNEATAAVPVLRSISVIIPQARVLNFVQSLATGSYAFVGSAEAQLKAVDSVTGELLAAAADQRRGGVAVTTTLTWKWGDAERIMNFWASESARRLQRLRAQSN
jgi:Protein of unknown function (DUF3313)